MGDPKQFVKEKLIIGVLIFDRNRFEELNSRLSQEFGPVDYTSPFQEFTYTDYYAEEMGTPLYRCFLSFKKLVSPDVFADIKLLTNRIEDEFRNRGNRTVNLDPGLLALSRFSLATTKDNAHRIPLFKGIYAEITLLYSNKAFHPLPWTYPDYRSESYTAVLCEIRELYRKQLKVMDQNA